MDIIRLSCALERSNDGIEPENESNETNSVAARIDACRLQSQL